MQREEGTTPASPGGEDGTTPAGRRGPGGRRRAGVALAGLVAAGAVAGLVSQQGAAAAPTPSGVRQTMTASIGSAAVPGDSGAAFDVVGWSWTVKPLAGTRNRERIALSVTHVVGAGSPRLMDAYGRQSGLTVRVVLARPGPASVATQTYVFGECTVGQLRHASSTAADPTDAVTFGCRSVRLDVTTQNPDGTAGPVVSSRLDAATMPLVP